MAKVVVVKALPLDGGVIIPVDKAFLKSKRGRPSFIQGMSFLRTIASGAVMAENGWKGQYSALIVHCREHDRAELVPQWNYRYDLRYWYDAGRHPRFSIIKALLSAKQSFQEIQMELMENMDFGKFLRRILKSVETTKDFLKRVYPWLFSPMRVRGRRYRVRNSFREKVATRSFTVKDFFEEPNQDLRRLMLRSFTMQDVLSGMHLVAEDDEGSLYQHPVQGRYLYIKCPSTGQEYLLAVPDDVPTPKAARRWTFGLEEDAEFVREA